MNGRRPMMATETISGCEQLLTRKQVAALLAVSPKTVDRLSGAARDGRGAFPRPLHLGTGKQPLVRYRASAVRAYQEQLFNDAGDK